MFKYFKSVAHASEDTNIKNKSKNFYSVEYNEEILRLMTSSDWYTEEPKTPIYNFLVNGNVDNVTFNHDIHTLIIFGDINSECLTNAKITSLTHIPITENESYTAELLEHESLKGWTAIDKAIDYENIQYVGYENSCKRSLILLRSFARMLKELSSLSDKEFLFFCKHSIDSAISYSKACKKVKDKEQ